MQNLHTHTTFSDGADTPEQIIERAIELGFDSIGISDHAVTEFKSDIEADTEGYIKKIRSLKDKYEGKINVFLGIELDYYSKGLVDPKDFDYTIGSVHYAKKSDGTPIEYDYAPSIALSHLENDFSGNALEYARAYYERVASLKDRFDFDIVAHFDVISKFDEQYAEFFNTGSHQYQNLAIEALDEIRKKKDLFELNTGAVARGWKSSPYPAKFILQRMAELDCKMVISSDCHDMRFLDCYFREGRELLSSMGFKEIYRLTENGFTGEKI